MRARRAAGIALKLRMGLATRKLGILRPDSLGAARLLKSSGATLSAVQEGSPAKIVRTPGWFVGLQ